MLNLNNKPLALSEGGLSIISALEWHNESEALTYQNYNGIAVIPVSGILTKRDEMFFETTSYEGLRQVISEALEDDSVNALFLDIDSPGGEVFGLFEFVDFIYKAKSIKPIFAHVNDSAFSAAYAIASATSKIYVNRTSGVGSIGVIATHIDVSEYDKKEGLKYTSIIAGSKKNDLSPHEKLSEEATKDLQIEVDRLYEILVSTVARNRGITPEQIRATEAATYFGDNAIKIGLADELNDDPLSKIANEFGAVSDKSTTEKEETEKMNEDYKAEVLEIAKLCKLAHAEHKLPEFLEKNLNAGQVKETLLASMNTQEEISSKVYQKESTTENPVIAAAKRRAQIN